MGVRFVPYRKGSVTIWFEYGAGNSRKRRRQGNFNTWYLNGGADVQIERLTPNNNSEVTTKYHYMANGKVVGIDEETDSGTESRYLHSDRLGSASVLTDELGDVLEKMSYDIWGQVRSVTSGGTGSVLKSQYHTKSYTGHEALADVDLVHMNGRIYDPILGRFMSADPFVQFAYNSQSYNRYSYVLNNPLGATDPSGYMSDSVDGYDGGEDDSREVTWSETKVDVAPNDNEVGNDGGLSPNTDSDLVGRSGSDGRSSGSGGGSSDGNAGGGGDQPESALAGPVEELSALDLFAKRVLDFFNPKSMRWNKEYGGFILRSPDGILVYTVLPERSFDALTLDLQTIPEEYEDYDVLGDWHTHGNYSTTWGKVVTKEYDEMRSDFFSDTDYISGHGRGIINEIDTGTTEYRSYLGTPSGVYMGYNAFTRKEYVIN